MAATVAPRRGGLPELPSIHRKWYEVSQGTSAKRREKTRDRESYTDRGSKRVHDQRNPIVRGSRGKGRRRATSRVEKRAGRTRTTRFYLYVLYLLPFPSFLLLVFLLSPFTPCVPHSFLIPYLPPLLLLYTPVSPGIPALLYSPSP